MGGKKRLIFHNIMWTPGSNDTISSRTSQFLFCLSCFKLGFQLSQLRILMHYVFSICLKRTTYVITTPSIWRRGKMWLLVSLSHMTKASKTTSWWHSDNHGKRHLMGLKDDNSTCHLRRTAIRKEIYCDDYKSRYYIRWLCWGLSYFQRLTISNVLSFILHKQ